MRALAFAAAAGAALVLAAPVAAGRDPVTEVVVELDAPGLAQAVRTSRVLTDAARSRRLDLRSPTSRGYVRELARRQRALEGRIVAAIPTARVRWQFSVVLDAVAVAAPGDQLDTLRRLPGVRRVYEGASFRPTLDRSPGIIGADDLWNAPTSPARGEGMKIGVIDDGVDPSHPFFDPAGYSYPPGFPKGNRQFTTPKVIAARVFTPPTSTWKYARLPFDPSESEHGTHVAGIAAGNAIAAPVPGRGPLSGVAPRAYIGNYKALSTPSSFGLIDNAAEVVAAIEAAVKDGMDVINMSFGEFETDPLRSPVDRAVDGAAAAGVVPVAAAGNSYDELGRGSVGSPATAARAISVGAVTKSNVLAGFSSSGPTSLSLLLKPEVSAPGVGILSSVPARLGSWASFSGTSMASPHVAGAAALLMERHPDWSVDEVASALVLTGVPVADDTGAGEAATTREGGGLVQLAAADTPRVSAMPYTLAFGLLRPGASAGAQVTLSDAGGGVGTWNASARLQGAPDGVKVSVPRTVGVPGRFTVDVAIGAGASESDVTGFVVLDRDGLTRHIPLWLRVSEARLGPPAKTLPGQGTYRGDTSRGRALVASYRYPDDPRGMGVSNTLPGPEQVFRFRLVKPVANIGVRITSAKRGVAVSPRIVIGNDENRLVGVPALPVDVNPYRDSYGEDRLVSAVIRPSPRDYGIVVDTRLHAAAGAYSFRFWVNDVTPPKVRLLPGSARSGGEVLFSATDGGSGIDPESARATVDGRSAPVTVRRGRIHVRLNSVRPDRHRVVVSIADFQETKNSESVLGILPNTTTVRSTIRVR